MLNARALGILLVVVAAPVVLCGDAVPPAKPTGRVFYVDPATGNAQNDGSAARPWKTIEEVIKAGLIGGKGRSNGVRPGDTVLLRSGYHGELHLKGGDNEEFITIAAQEGQEPQVCRVEIDGGKKWIIRGLTISPSFGKDRYKGNMASLAEREEGSELILEDCFLYTELDASKWTIDDWMKASSGINMGRHGTNITVRNCHVLNTRFGIALCSPDSLCEGNLIANFSADAMRVTRDGITVQYNTIKNAYVSDGEGDKNHDDAIQCFLFNKGTGTVRKATIRGNLIISREDPNQPFFNHMQAIGFFDGPLVDFLVEKNVCLVSHWHGVALYDAQNCTVQDNCVWTKWQDLKMRPWVMIGQKNNLAKGNTVKNNLACSFNFGADPQITEENNRKVTEKEFYQRMAELEALIASKFGKYHPVSRFARVGNERIDKIPPKQPEAAVAAKDKNDDKKPAAQPVAAPVSRPEAPPLADAALAPWKKRVLERLAAAAKAGKKPQASMKVFGRVSRVQVTGCSDTEISLVLEGGTVTVAVNKLERPSWLGLAQATVDSNKASDLALAAVWARAAGEPQVSADYLEKADHAPEKGDAAMLAEATALLK